MFIVIEGPDGSGKTTLANHLVAWLNKIGKKAIYTQEPTSQSPAGQKIRELLRSGDVTDAYALSDLFTADRKEHLKTCILPHIERGDWVICDRYVYSSLAYQKLQGVCVQHLVQSNAGYLVPDVAFVLLPQSVDVLFRRIASRQYELDIFEKKEFLERIITSYQELVTYFPEDNLIYLNADLSADEAVAQAQKNIEKLL